MCRNRPSLAAALWREILIEGSIFREWIVNLGRREATARLAHLLIEMHTRLKAIGHTLQPMNCHPGAGVPVTKTRAPPWTNGALMLVLEHPNVLELVGCEPTGTLSVQGV